MSCNRSKRHARSARNAGFTIVEAVIVITVIAIMGAVAAPRFLSLDELNSAQAAREALADLRFAQQRAALSGCPVQVDMDAAGYRLTHRTACRSGAFTLDLIDPVTNISPYDISLPPALMITSNVDPIVFDVLGRATSVSGVVSNVAITIGTSTLAIEGETGLVHEP